MSTTTLVVLNVILSLLAFAAVGCGALIAYRLGGRPRDDGGRAGWRGPRPISLAQCTAASIATATNSRARYSSE